VLRTGANIARQGVPPWIPLFVPLFKEQKEKDIKSHFVSLAAKPLRAADMPKQEILRVS
jgi:hypothetical protein